MAKNQADEEERAKLKAAEALIKPVTVAASVPQPITHDPKPVPTAPSTEVEPSD